MDIVGSLTAISESLRVHDWTQEQYFVLIETLLRLVARGQSGKAQRRLITKISKSLSPSLTPLTRSKLPPLFHQDCGDLLLTLQLYSLLQVPPNLPILSLLVESYARSPKFFPDQIPAYPLPPTPTEAILALETKAGAVFVTNPDPCPALISEYISVALVEKQRSAHLTVLYRGLLARVAPPLFKATLFPVLQRLIIRSGATLTPVAQTIEMLTIDLTDCAAELVYPAILDYLYRGDTAQSALNLISRLAAKAQSHTDLVAAFLATQDQTEAQTWGLIRCLSLFKPSPAYNDQVVEYCLDRNHRLRSDETRQAVLLCIGRFATRLTARLTAFFEKEGARAAAVNLFTRLGGKSLSSTAISGLNPMQIAVLLSVGIPTPCPPAIKSFLTDSASPLGMLVPSNPGESLAIARLCLIAVELFPTSVVIRKRIVKGLLQDNASRNLLIPAWPAALPTAEVCAVLTEAIDNQEMMQALRHNYRRVTRFLVEKSCTVEDWTGLLRLYMGRRIAEDEDSRRTFQFFVTKYGHIVNSVPFMAICESPYSSALFCLLGGYTEFTRIAAAALAPGLFARINRLIGDFDRAVQDPEFMESLTLDSLARQLAKARNIPLCFDSETERTKELLRVTYRRAIETGKFVLKVFRVCTEMFKWVEGEGMKRELVEKGVFLGVKLAKVGELAEAVFSSTSSILKTIPLFAPISLDLLKLLFSLERGIWKEKTAKRLISYISDRVSLELISPSEALIFSHIVFAAIYQPATNLRASAIDILARLVYERKVQNWEQILDLVVHLLRTYSGVMYANLFMALREMIEPAQWRPLLMVANSLPAPSKPVLLSNLLQYEGGLPHRSWTEAPLWLLLNDEFEETADLALAIWHKFRLSLSPSTILSELPTYLFEESDEIQGSAARGLAAIWTLFPGYNRMLFDRLCEEFGRRTVGRTGFVTFLGLLVPVLSAYSIEILRLIISEAASESLRGDLIDLGVRFMKEHGKSLVSDYFAVLQNAVREQGEESKLAAVILLGNLAQFFPQKDAKVDLTIELLLKALSSKHEALYQPISDCLPRLISYRRDQGRKILNDYLKVLFSPVPILDKRGSAYGLASILKGLGIDAFVRFRVKDKFDEIINNKLSTGDERGSVLLAIEGVTSVLRTSFESYLREVVPFVLDCFSDSLLFPQAQLTIKSLITGLSTLGVRLILPLLTHGLEDSKWKSQVSAIQALGKMAFCAPKRLSEFLPTVVQQVTKAFSNTHPSVIQSAYRALEDIGSVVTTPEISQSVPIYIKALSDASLLREALTVLLETHFTHCIDAPSLSLLIPIIEGGLRSRASEVKKMATQAVGGLLALVSQSLFEPYIARIVSAMKSALFDPIPEVRNVAAQNLGQLCKFMGRKRAQDVLIMLEAVFLTDVSSQTDRSGAVHAYSEVVLRLTNGYWETVLPGIVAKSQDSNPLVRLFALGVMLFLANSPYSHFETHIETVLPPIQANLTHSHEEVRTLSVRLMHLLIRTYSREYLDRILPQLEGGLFAASLKTRLNAVTLVGEVLEVVETMDRRQGRKESTIPPSHRNRILAAVYILRADTAGAVSNQAGKVWKSRVENTPRMIPTITGDVVEQILEIAEIGAAEPLQIAFEAIQIMLKKYEEDVFSEFLRHFYRQLAGHPRGVAIALREVCDCASKKVMSAAPEELARIMQKLLWLEDEGVLAEAGEIFEVIVEKLQAEAFKEFVGGVVGSIVERPKAYRQLVRHRNPGVLRTVLPSIMKLPTRGPVLLEIGDLLSNEIICGLPDSKGFFPAILKESKDSQPMLAAATKIVAGITDLKSLAICLENLALLDPGPAQIAILYPFLVNTRLDLTHFAAKLLDFVVPAVHYQESSYIVGPAISAIITPMKREEIHTVLSVITRELTGFSLFLTSTSLQPILYVLYWSVMLGPSEVREPAIRAYCELINVTETAILEPFYREIVGTLLRLSCDRLHFSIREAVLSAFHFLIRRGGVSLKGFLPQLRVVVRKALQSDQFHVRHSALRLLGDYLGIEQRLDVVLIDLSTLQGDTDTILTCLKALTEISKKTTLPPSLALQVIQRLLDSIENEASESVVEAVGEVVGKLGGERKAVIESFRLGGKQVVAMGYFLGEVEEEDVKLASGLYSQALGMFPSETVKSLTLVAKHHPKATFLLCMPLFPRFLPLLSPSLVQLFLGLPPEEFSKDPPRIAEFLIALANEAKIGRSAELDTIVSHIFSIRPGKGVKSALKVLYLLANPLQNDFREYVYSLLPS